ncbi:MAG: diguanylate cyclase [Desulfobacteraceae bacterium]|nr:diguanylate cyclase [Desulfobacteraceae bacterium]
MGTNDCMTGYSDRTVYMEIERTRILAGNLARSMPSTVINSMIIVMVLWNVVPKTQLIFWCLLNIGFTLVRYQMLHFYRKGFKRNNFILWQRSLMVSFLIAGSLFGGAGLFLTDFSRLEYLVFIYFIVGGMVAGSLGSYHNHLAMFFSYSLTVFFLPTAVLFYLGTDVTFSMAILGMVFFAIMSVNAKKMNRDLSEFLVLRYDNNQLVEQFNQEKLQTEKLNRELVRKNNRLKEISRIDPLTGLKNRHYLFDILKPRIEKAISSLWIERKGIDQRKTDYSCGYGVISIDIDHFKRVNDNYGHDSGDMVLKQFSDRLCDQIREDDVVGRIGGEEFVIILKNTKESHLSVFAEKIRHHVAQSDFKVTDNRTINITCSIGMIFYPFFRHHPGNMMVEHVFYLVDKALYFAKENGRNRSVKVVCSERDSLDSRFLKSITADLNQAIDARQIRFES